MNVNAIIASTNPLVDPVRNHKREQVLSVLIDLQVSADLLENKEPRIADKIRASLALMKEWEAVLGFYGYATCDNFADDRGRSARSALGSLDFERHRRIG